ncbi:hypothetical protein RHGRI_004298 [Rhododendron griersonianum]|uniref:Uncharacterized protein n=1 Tax=Rhododendron griersonianum TaxID=479676 RepID=A0AAV6L940_9ERIC|nr:hypothetical protein RHGRI_004298 [Rhododendron griersonianum]
MNMINQLVEIKSNGSAIQIRVMEEQMVVNTILRTDCACPGCRVEDSSLKPPTEESKEVNATDVSHDLPDVNATDVAYDAGINNRNRILLNESQAVWTATNILGTDYLGNDEKVISNIMVTDEEELLSAAITVHPSA